MKDTKLLPTGIICISKAIEQVEMMPDPIPEEESADGRCDYKHYVPNYRIEHRRDFNHLTAHIGICLHCLKLGKAELSYCNMVHT